ncbi:MAG: sigma-70 family RNA polymerase sigma factor [Muribaculaceae bacterium]|nr:sigma-70 family RNA polymerase sigma factor [Muribaculaceae bacterium]
MIDFDYLFEEFSKGRMREFYDLVYPGLMTYAAQLLGPELGYMAEDCVQDAVISTYDHLSRISDSTHWRRYLLMSIRNRISNIHRHKNISDIYEASKPDSDYEPDISLSLIRQETLDSLFAAINSLPEQYRDIFRLNFEKGLKTHEIAELLNVADITVKKRKAKMISLLRHRLRPDQFQIFILFILLLPENVPAIYEYQ